MLPKTSEYPFCFFAGIISIIIPTKILGLRTRTQFWGRTFYIISCCKILIKICINAVWNKVAFNAVNSSAFSFSFNILSLLFPLLLLYILSPVTHIFFPCVCLFLLLPLSLFLLFQFASSCQILFHTQPPSSFAFSSTSSASSCPLLPLPPFLFPLSCSPPFSLSFFLFLFFSFLSCSSV